MSCGIVCFVYYVCECLCVLMMCVKCKICVFVCVFVLNGVMCVVRYCCVC